MAGVNKVILLGNLTRDPETSYTTGGMAVCKFTIATSKKVKGEDVSSFHRCVAFDKRGEAIGKYVTKGQQLYIEGELQYGQYEKDGVTHYTTDIIVNQFTFVGGKGQNQQHNGTGDNIGGNKIVNQGYQNQGQQQGYQQQQQNQYDSSSDIPF